MSQECKSISLQSQFHRLPCILIPWSDCGKMWWPCNVVMRFPSNLSHSKLSNPRNASSCTCPSWQLLSSRVVKNDRYWKRQPKKNEKKNYYSNYFYHLENSIKKWMAEHVCRCVYVCGTFEKRRVNCVFSMLTHQFTLARSFAPNLLCNIRRGFILPWRRSILTLESDFRSKLIALVTYSRWTFPTVWPEAYSPTNLIRPNSRGHEMHGHECETVDFLVRRFSAN